MIVSAVLILLEKRKNEKEKKMKHAATFSAFFKVFGQNVLAMASIQTISNFDTISTLELSTIVQLSQNF